MHEPCPLCKDPGHSLSSCRRWRLASVSNCWIVAKLFYWRLRRKGVEAYWVRRRSRAAKCPHWLVSWRLPSGYLHTVSFKPLILKKRLLPPLFFKGEVEWGDWPETLQLPPRPEASP